MYTLYFFHKFLELIQNVYVMGLRKGGTWCIYQIQLEQCITSKLHSPGIPSPFHFLHGRSERAYRVTSKSPSEPHFEQLYTGFV